MTDEDLMSKIYIKSTLLKLRETISQNIIEFDLLNKNGLLSYFKNKIIFCEHHGAYSVKIIISNGIEEEDASVILTHDQAEELCDRIKALRENWLE
jgi:hypothetical protein